MANLNQSLLVGTLMEAPIATIDGIFFSVEVAGRNTADDSQINIVASTPAAVYSAREFVAGDVVFVTGELHNGKNGEIYLRAFSIERRTIK